MAERKSIIAPSLLAADFSEIGKAVRQVEQSGADWIHLDVMDGCFVPQITFGSQMISAVRGITSLPLDVHLMTMNPASHLDSFVQAGADRFTFHIEAEVHAHHLLSTIRKFGIKAGISVVPSTPISAIKEILGMVDQVLVMTVNPGWGGQLLIPPTLAKIRELWNLRKGGLGDYLICMDGGFSIGTAVDVWEAGADVAVMGTAFFGSQNSRELLEKCRPAVI